MACNMWIMWIDAYTLNPQESFNPDAIVSRAEFGTVLSRVLWWNKFDQDDTWDTTRYQKHLQSLKEKWYMNFIDWQWPNYEEIRKFVWIMFERVFNDK
jgi:hypothetical protein